MQFADVACALKTQTAIIIAYSSLPFRKKRKGGPLHPRRQPPLVLCRILFSQSLKILSSSLSMVPALANSSVSA